MQKGTYQLFMTFMGDYISMGKTMGELRAVTASRARPKRPEPCSPPPVPPKGVPCWGPQYETFKREHEAEFTAWNTYSKQMSIYNRQLQEYREGRFDREFEKDMW